MTQSYRLGTYVKESDTCEKFLYPLRKYLSNTNTYIPSQIWNISVAHSTIKNIKIVEIDKMFLILSYTDEKV